MINFDKIPKALTNRDQWVMWKIINRDGKPNKVPFQPTGSEAKSNDPQTWETFHAVREAYDPARHAGIGFVFSHYDPFCGIDLDGCRNPETQKIEDWAREIIQAANTYCEVSPSGTGVKLFCEGKSPFTGGKKKTLDDAPAVGDKKPGVEIYDSLRYFAVTGLRVIGPTEPQACQAFIREFGAKFFPATLPVIIPAGDLRNSGEVIDRAEKYLATLPPAISGSSGHNATFKAACVLVLGFGLNPDQAYPLMMQFNARCAPPWSEREIRHKLTQAAKQSGERNYLRDAHSDNWHSIKVPSYTDGSRSLAVDPSQPVTELVTLQDAAEKYLVCLETGQNQLIDLGIADLDHAIGGGVAPGEMIIIAARPGHGKSAFGLQALDTCALNGMPGLIISEEMSKLALGKRVIQFACDTPEEHWKSQSDGVRKELELHFATRAPVYVAENCRTAEKACATVEHFIKNHGVKITAVDYAQILGSAGKTPYERVTATSSRLRILANETGISILVLCQLNRAVDSRDKFIPRNSDLKDSGQFEQDADVIVFLVWPHRIDSDKPAHEFQIYISKNRNRAINQTSIKCKFYPSRQMIMPEPPKNFSRELASFNEPKHRDDF